MKDRGRLRIKLCGIAAPADRAALKLPAEGELAPEQQEMLLALARERALAIKGYLVDIKGVEGVNLFVCTPVVEASEASQPRVSLQL